MRKSMLVILVLCLLALGLPAQPAAAGPASVTLPPYCDRLAVRGSILCAPLGVQDWIVFAHGYVPAGAPPDTAWEQLKLPDGSTIPALVNGLGYGFAASEYSKNGLAIKEGIHDTVALAQYLRDNRGARNVYLVGASEGGLITTLIMEGSSQFMDGLDNPFNGAVSACGPNGDFRLQINYLGDFRVLFDYFFHPIFPGSKWYPLPPYSPVNVPPDVTKDWLNPLFGGASLYQAQVVATIANPANAGKVAELMRTSRAAVDPSNPATAITTALGALNYDIVGTNNATDTLKVQPYTNRGVWYFGSNNDLKLNFGVERINSDRGAISAALGPYQTTGKLTRPLVTIHTTLDQEVPAWQQFIYRVKVWNSGSGALYNGIPIPRYGHCAFKPEELVLAFYLMVFKTTGVPFTSSQLSMSLADPASLEGFNALLSQYGTALIEDPPLKFFMPVVTN